MDIETYGEHIAAIWTEEYSTQFWGCQCGQQSDCSSPRIEFDFPCWGGQNTDSIWHEPQKSSCPSCSGRPLSKKYLEYLFEWTSLSALCSLIHGVISRAVKVHMLYFVVRTCLCSGRKLFWVYIYSPILFRGQNSLQFESPKWSERVEKRDSNPW